MHDLTLRFGRDLGKRPYRFKCRFIIEAYPTKDRLKQGALKAHDLFVRDMAKMDPPWEYLSSEPPRLKGPFTPVVPMTLRVRRPPSSREMLPAVWQGAKFRAGEETLAQIVTPLSQNESWEYELSLVFVRETIRFEVPDQHEEKVGSR
mgnify:CR=1 FL=1